jgi:hypothetical protein
MIGNLSDDTCQANPVHYGDDMVRSRPHYSPALDFPILAELQHEIVWIDAKPRVCTERIVELALSRRRGDAFLIRWAEQGKGVHAAEAHKSMREEQ